MIAVGIDPGVRGGIAKLELEGQGEHGRLYYAERLPTARVGNFDYTDEKKLRRFARDPDVDCAAIERVWGRRHDSPSGAFRFGHSYGVCLASFSVILTDVETPTPRKWKGALGIGGGDEGKAQALAIAAEMWPDKAAWFQFKADSGRAEAALIAYWRLALAE